MSDDTKLLLSNSNSPSDHECPICLTSIDSCHDKIITSPQCQHFFCKDCFTQYLTTEIISFRALKIKCPQETCSHRPDTALIQKLLDPDLFKTYQKHVLAKVSNRTPGHHFCPQSGCSKALNLNYNDLETICSCGARVCSKCGDFCHQGKTCFEVLNPEFEAYVEDNNVKFCFMCKTLMVKVEGCVHITCPVCDYEWCWLCGQEHDPNHAKTCSRKWNPLIPNILIKEENKEIQQQSFLKKCIFAILSLCFEQFFWLFVQMNIKDVLKSEQMSLETKTDRFLLALYLNGIYIAAFIFFNWLLSKFPEKKLCFRIVLLLILILPWVVKGFISYKTYQEKKRKRWRSRDANVFGYTKASQPQQNPRNNNINIEYFEHFDNDDDDDEINRQIELELELGRSL